MDANRTSSVDFPRLRYTMFVTTECPIWTAIWQILVDGVVTAAGTSDQTSASDQDHSITVPHDPSDTPVYQGRVYCGNTSGTPIYDSGPLT